jgi:DNA-binding HxlR family transcriptional regulator
MLGASGSIEQRALFGERSTFWCNLLMQKPIKKSSPPLRSTYKKLEDVVGCKWSVSVLQAVGAGIARPGALERHIDGISTKVLSERLRKLTQYELLSKQIFAESPPRTEYRLTEKGRKLVDIIDRIRTLDEEPGKADKGDLPDG